jgi:hypothetical protein
VIERERERERYKNQEQIQKGRERDYLIIRRPVYPIQMNYYFDVSEM